MNIGFYLLGTPDGYNQYPLDEKEELFRSFHDNVKSDTQLTVYRNADIVYYVYTRNMPSLGKDQYFGMVIALNGLYLSHIGNVFSVFEQLCSNIALRGKILNIDKTGRIRFVHSRFVDTPEEIETTIRECRELVETNLSDCVKRLPEDYVVQTNTVTIAYDDSFKTGSLHKQLEEYTQIHFTKNEDGNSGYVDMVVTRLYEENRALKKEYNRLKSQKKQYKIVVLLLVLLFVFGGGLFLLNTYIDEQNITIEQKNDTISNQSEHITSLNTTIDQQTVENSRLKSLYNETDTENKRLKERVKEQQLAISNLDDQLSLQRLELDGLRRNIGSTFPVLISSVQMGNFYSDGTKETDYGNAIYSSYSSYIEPKITFRGLTSGTVTLKMKLYRPDGSMWRDSSSPYNCTRSSYITSSLNVQKSVNTTAFRIGGYRGYWGRGTYRIEFWYNDSVCLYSTTFNIY